jgi:hypothetical protein
MIARQGIDPVEVQREAKRKEKALNFSAYCDTFVDLYLQPHWPDTWPEAMREVIRSDCLGPKIAAYAQ